MTDKIVVIPVMYTIRIAEADSDGIAEDAARQLVMDLTEENWYDKFTYNNQILDFIGFDWLDGAYVDVYRGGADEDVSEATEDGTSETSGGLRDSVGDVQDSWDGDEGLPM